MLSQADSDLMNTISTNSNYRTSVSVSIRGLADDGTNTLIDEVAGTISNSNGVKWNGILSVGLVFGRTNSSV